MTALFFLGDGLWPQPVSVVCQGFLQSGESEAEHKEAWKTAYLSLKSPSEAIQGPFDSFVPRAGLLLNGAVILLKWGIIWELALYPLCTLQVVSLHTKDELAAVNKSRNSSMGGGEKKDLTSLIGFPIVFERVGSCLPNATMTDRGSVPMEHYNTIVSKTPYIVLL